MTTKILLAGLLGGVAMFVWMFVAHMVLPLGMVGMREIPNEQAVLAPMRAAIGETSGMYLFPGMGVGPNPTREQQQAAMSTYGEKLAQNPSGLLIYHPPGEKPITPGQLITEFLQEVIESLVVAFLLAQTRLGGFAAKVGFVLLIGIVAAITTNGSYWNWFGFPASYTLASITSQVVGYLCAGLVIAYFVKPR